MALPINDIVSEQRLRESYRKHATLAQLNRMWQYQERTGSGVGNLLDMMTPDVVVQSPHLSVRGHGEMRAALGDIPIDWQAGHVLKDWRIAVDEGTTAFDARIEYLTAAPGGAATSAEATYAARFVSVEGFLPKLARIDVTQGEARDGAVFKDMFAEHRARSVVHYFLALVENPARDADPFFELLAQDFALHYTANPITDEAAMRDWIAGPLSSVIASEHDLHSVTCSETGAGVYVAEVTMKSQAMFPDKSGAISRNTQHWTMTDTITDRFPRITEILIDRDSVVRFDANGIKTG